VEGKAEVLSKPSMIATQGLPAELVTSESVPTLVLDTSNSAINAQGLVQGSNQNYKVAPAETGVTLRVTPSHVGDSFVTLKVNPEVKGISGLAATQGGTLAPITTVRRADTTVTMGDGETLVIGGLYTNSHITEKAKTPLLSDIPVVGCLFTRTRETKAKTELVILITPRIVRKTAELRVITPPAELERLEQTRQATELVAPCGPPCLPNPFAPKPVR
jgi:general secretion pathway protein D